jgi:hypothetical protein
MRLAIASVIPARLAPLTPSRERHPMQATPAGVATRVGLITGLFIGVLSLPFITLMRLSGAPGLGALFLLIALVAYAIAGFLATRRSGLLRSGVGSGALAAAITLFIAICLGIVILALLAPRLALGLPIPPALVHGVRGPLARAAARRVVGVAGFTIIASLLIMGLGLLGGFLGGLFGRLGRRRPPVSPTYSAPSPAPQFTPSAMPVTPVTPGVPFAPSYPPDPAAAPYAQPAPYDPGDTPTVTDGGQGI